MQHSKSQLVDLRTYFDDLLRQSDIDLAEIQSNHEMKGSIIAESFKRSTANANAIEPTIQLVRQLMDLPNVTYNSGSEC